MVKFLMAVGLGFKLVMPNSLVARVIITFCLIRDNLKILLQKFIALL